MAQRQPWSDGQKSPENDTDTPNPPPDVRHIKHTVVDKEMVIDKNFYKVQ